MFAKNPSRNHGYGLTFTFVTKIVMMTNKTSPKTNIIITNIYDEAKVIYVKSEYINYIHILINHASK